MPSTHPNARLEADDHVDQHRWPTPRDDETEVLLVGSDHVAGREGLDVLADARQREFRALVDRLADWAPDAVAVELPYDAQDRLDDVYDDYRRDERAYDEVTAFEPFSPYTDDSEGECRSEAVQVGFRLADHLGRERVHAVDDPMTLDAHLDETEAAELDADGLFANLDDALDVPVPDGPDLDARWNGSTVTEVYRWLHRDEHLLAEEQRQSAMALTKLESPTVGARIRTAWYERNLRMLEHLWRATEAADADRMALVVGSSHVHILRGLMRDAPPLCPVHPRPLLSEA